MIFSTTRLPPILFDLCYGGDTTVAFLEGMGLSLSVGALVWWPVRNHRGDLKMRDGFLVVVLLWAVLSAFGAVPLLATHVGWHIYIEELFEAVTGLSTNGATSITASLAEITTATPHTHPK